MLISRSDDGAGRATRRCATAALLCLLGAAGCATLRPEARAAKRDEEAVERLPPPLPPRPVPAVAAPAPRAASAAPATPTSATAARPFAALAAPTTAGATEVALLVDDLLFAPGSAALDAAAISRLGAVVTGARSLAGRYRVEIQGHSDDRGDEAGNLRLSLRRAEAVRRHLVEAAGLPAERITVVALGSRHPAADNATATGRARNRRAVVFLLR